MNHVAQQFASEGYVIAEQLYAEAEVEALRLAIDEVLERLTRERPEQAERVHRQGVYVGMAAASPRFHEAARKPELVRMLQEVLPGELEFLSDKLVFKSKQTAFDSPWHQDWEYWQGSHKVSAWIALDDATPDNGCLKVVPGSHRAGRLPHTAPPSDEQGFVSRVDERRIDPSRIRAVPLRAGSALIFHDLLLHASYANVSGARRRALIGTYRSAATDDPEYAWATSAFRIGGGRV
ncbi:phytanoyl-CoA dioxygenase family protein [Paenibacillus sp. IB182496]|uniref:Phytanoyl-CoA dioxygenase family protein n=1 Tax=Paenibacillus sabuli TaxID=2772509 RepID=A0A927BNL1_9BACL|nr:phytanoyl-CoA dioxygenase family protein [Paenibacillus sabuli]MBD2843836.1 phytanoyl-CoA dioxygenase family protein [Paenibacillus sabuli]